LSRISSLLEPDPPVSQVGVEPFTAPAKDSRVGPAVEATGAGSTPPASQPQDRAAPCRLRRSRRPPAGRRLVSPEEPIPVALTPEQRLLVLNAWRRSGLPAGDFAPLVGVSKHTLYAWKHKVDLEGPAGLLDQPRGSKPGGCRPGPSLPPLMAPPAPNALARAALEIAEERLGHRFRPAPRPETRQLLAARRQAPSPLSR
jgi:hypothetical protein